MKKRANVPNATNHLGQPSRREEVAEGEPEMKRYYGPLVTKKEAQRIQNEVRKRTAAEKARQPQRVQMPPVTTCDNCHLTYYQTSAAHVCAGVGEGRKGEDDGH